MSDKLIVELTDAEVGVRRDSSDFEQRAAFAAFTKAGEGSFRLHDIEPIEGGVRVHLAVVEDKDDKPADWTDEEEMMLESELAAAEAFAEEDGCAVCGKEGCCTFDHDADNDIFDGNSEATEDDADLEALREMIAQNARILEAEAGGETDPEKLNPILSLDVESDKTVTLSAAEVCAILEIIDFTESVLSMPKVQIPPDGRSLPVSMERLRMRLGINGFLGFGLSRMPDGSVAQHWMVMPEFQPHAIAWHQGACAEYDRQHGRPSPIVIARDSTGLRTEE